ncbi:MAG: hypothetical protein IKD04_08175 [Clostridia bacterium]|nr:hypothetical protein [Clostridia bacterium]
MRKKFDFSLLTHFLVLLPDLICELLFAACRGGHSAFLFCKITTPYPDGVNTFNPQLKLIICRDRLTARLPLSLRDISLTL